MSYWSSCVSSEENVKFWYIIYFWYQIEEMLYVPLNGTLKFLGFLFVGLHFLSHFRVLNGNKGKEKKIKVTTIKHWEMKYNSYLDIILV